MNMFFGAHKQGIAIDTCSLGDGDDDALLQQAADITGGAWIQANEASHLPSAFIQNLMRDDTFQVRILC